jgi:hypothetical protein
VERSRKRKKLEQNESKGNGYATWKDFEDEDDDFDQKG